MRRMWAKGQLDTEIKKVIESGKIENAKPLYWHSCRFYKEVSDDLSYNILSKIVSNLILHSVC